EVTLVPIAESYRAAPIHQTLDVSRRTLSALDRALRNPGDSFRVRAHECEVADDEHLGVRGQGQVCVHDDAAGSIHRRAQQLAQWRGLVSRRPEDVRRLDALLADGDGAALDVGHDGVRAHVDAQLLQL